MEHETAGWRLDVQCETAAEFLGALRLTNPLWGGRPSDTWAFRGQADASWGLVPTAFRPTTNLAYVGPEVNPPLPAERQRRAELKALNHFLFLADRIGLPVPGDGQHLRLPDTVQQAALPIDAWPWPAMLETLAIAQHHGVPTRLLDCSHDPLIAAYFAAHGAWTAEPRGERSQVELAVWAVDLRGVSACVEKHRERRERPTVIWVTASRASNTFLHHQDALFLLDLAADDRPAPPDLQYAIAEAPERAGVALGDGPLIVRVLLRTTEAAAVLRHLWNESYHPARLMPTYDNVVSTLAYRRALGI
jgi:hypothetical protein